MHAVRLFLFLVVTQLVHSFINSDTDERATLLPENDENELGVLSAGTSLHVNQKSTIRAS